MGEIEVCITYNSPDVREPSGKSRRGEKWGKLVPYRLSEERWLEIDSDHSTQTVASRRKRKFYDHIFT